jgi:PAS domain S-box-containing protein
MQDHRLRALGVALEPLIDLLPDGLLIMDEAGRIRYVNRTFATMTGYSNEGLLGERVEVLVPPGRRSAHMADRAAYAEEPEIRPMGSGLDIRCQRQDGTSFPADISLSPVTIDGRGLVVAAVRDATARRQVERSLREAERRWRDLLNGVQLVVVGLGTDGQVEFANPFLLSLTGYEPDEVLGADWFSTFLPSPDIDEVRTVFTQVLGQRGEEHHVNPILTKGGEQRLIGWFNTSLHDPDGHTVGTLSVGEDITDRSRAEAQLRAISEVTNAVLTDEPIGLVLRLLARRAHELAGAELATIAAPEGDAALVVAAADGPHAEMLEGTVLPLDGSIAGHVLRSGKAQLVDDASQEEGIYPPLLALGGVVPAFFVPLVAHDRNLGTLCVANPRGGRRFTYDDMTIVESFASQASIAIEYVRAQQGLKRLAVIEDRERIGRDLHDHVIQRLFAIGIGLEALHGRAWQDPVIGERLRGAVDQLDKTISDIRATIFDFNRDRTGTGLRGHVLSIIDEAAGSLGFRPEARFVGAVDISVPEEIANHVVAVVREALSNAARHARARAVSVHVEARSDQLLLRVADDGVGMPADQKRSSGLSNLEGRARQLGGTFFVGAGLEGGTLLEWRVPLSPPPSEREA